MAWIRRLWRCGYVDSWSIPSPVWCVPWTIGGLVQGPIISSNISNWESTLQSTISGLGQQMISIADKIDNNTKMLQDQISLSECRTNSHLKSLERNVSSLENNASSLQKDVHIFQIQTDSKLNEITGKILQLDTNILNPSKHDGTRTVLFSLRILTFGTVGTGYRSSVLKHYMNGTVSVSTYSTVWCTVVQYWSIPLWYW